jgi:hypothetical protein
MTAAEIEQIKSKASWLNSISVAVATAGAIGPIFTYIFGASANFDPWLLFGATCVCLVLGWFIHMTGQDLLGEIE